MNYVEKLCKDIMKLNNDLLNIILTLPELKGNLFISKIGSYNEKMAELAMLVKNNKSEFQFQLSNILDEGYPKYLAENVLEEEMKLKFNWTNTTMDTLKVLRTATYNVWADLVVLHEEAHTFV